MARTIRVCVPLLEGVSVPEHIRAWSSADVLAVEADIVGRLIDRATSPSQPMTLGQGDGERLDVAQRDAVAALAGTAEVLVVEGAAGAGKTTTLTAAAQLLEGQGHRLCVVTPTLKAAQVAGRELGASATSTAWWGTRPRGPVGRPRRHHQPRCGAPIQRSRIRRDQPRDAHRHQPSRRPR
jgi:exodeoxyribonuclease V alpha subunit